MVFLNDQQFSYALEMLKDEEIKRVLLISLKDSKAASIEWILYN